MKHSELSQYTYEQLAEYTHYELSLYPLIQLVIDRTENDVKRWRNLRDKGWSGMSEMEKREWLGETATTPAATKGMYTHNDLNRVEKAVETIWELFVSAGYNPPKITVKTDWMYTDTIRDTDMVRYYGNVALLRNFLQVFSNTPKAPTTDKRLDYKLANDIEKILGDVYEIVTNLMDSWYYPGEFISGEV